MTLKAWCPLRRGHTEPSWSSIPYCSCNLDTHKHRHTDLTHKHTHTHTHTRSHPERQTRTRTPTHTHSHYDTAIQQNNNSQITIQRSSGTTKQWKLPADQSLQGSRQGSVPLTPAATYSDTAEQRQPNNNIKIQRYNNTVEAETQTQTHRNTDT